MFAYHHEVMARLEDVPVEDLEATLVDLEGYREARRLIAAIMYKRGPSVPMLAEWLAVREATIYRWFDRLEDESVDTAIRDEPRPGRPSKLTSEQWTRFRQAVAEPPDAAGYDAPEWTTELARRYLSDAFDVEYSRRHVRRLVDEIAER